MEPTAVSLPWMEVLKLAVTTGLAASIAPIMAWQIERSTSKKSAETKARLLAARLAVTFEHFAIKCAEQIADNDMYRQSDGHAGRPHGTLPELGEFPPEANWTTLEPELLSRSFSLPNELLLGDKMIAHWSDVDPDPSLVRRACDLRAGTSGYRAWQLAEGLRGRYRLPSFVPKDFSWDAINTLKEHHDRELERIRKDQAGSA